MSRVGLIGGRVWVGVLVLLAAALGCSLSSRAPRADGDQARLPVVWLIAPENNAAYVENTQVQIYALAQDAAARIARLEFRVDQVSIGEVTASDPQGQDLLIAWVLWTAAGRSKHFVTVEAYSAEGFSLGMVDAVIDVVEAPGLRLIESGPAVNPGTGDSSSVGSEGAAP